MSKLAHSRKCVFRLRRRIQTSTMLHFRRKTLTLTSSPGCKNQKENSKKNDLSFHCDAVITIEARKCQKLCTFFMHFSNGRLRSVRVAHRAIPRKDSGSNPGGDRQTYISSAERLASFVTQATGGAGVKCGNALRKLTTPVPLRL